LTAATFTEAREHISRTVALSNPESANISAATLSIRSRVPTIESVIC